MKSTAYSAQSVSYSDMKSQFECCFVYNSLGPEQKCENISLLKIASLFPFVPALESDKREREREELTKYVHYFPNLLSSSPLTRCHYILLLLLDCPLSL